jgi:hypothetical protein
MACPLEEGRQTMAFRPSPSLIVFEGGKKTPFVAPPASDGSLRPRNFFGSTP